MTTHLVADRRPGTFQRRQPSCRLLDPCVDGWIRTRGSAQSRCPPGCAAYAGPGAEVLPEDPPLPDAGRTCAYCGGDLLVRVGQGRPRQFCEGTRCKQYHSEMLAEEASRG